MDAHVVAEPAGPHLRGGVLVALLHDAGLRAARSGAASRGRLPASGVGLTASAFVPSSEQLRLGRQPGPAGQHRDERDGRGVELRGEALRHLFRRDRRQQLLQEVELLSRREQRVARRHALVDAADQRSAPRPWPRSRPRAPRPRAAALRASSSSRAEKPNVRARWSSSASSSSAAFHLPGAARPEMSHGGSRPARRRTHAGAQEARAPARDLVLQPAVERRLAEPEQEVVAQLPDGRGERVGRLEMGDANVLGVDLRVAGDDGEALLVRRDARRFSRRARALGRGAERRP